MFTVLHFIEQKPKDDDGDDDDGEDKHYIIKNTNKNPSIAFIYRLDQHIMVFIVVNKCLIVHIMVTY
jgi:hypothetical protein